MAEFLQFQVGLVQLALQLFDAVVQLRPSHLRRLQLLLLCLGLASQLRQLGRRLLRSNKQRRGGVGEWKSEQQSDWQLQITPGQRESQAAVLCWQDPLGTTRVHSDSGYEECPSSSFFPT